MIETRIIIAIFNAHYPLRAELGKILEVLVLVLEGLALVLVLVLGGLVLVLVLEKLRTCPALQCDKSSFSTDVSHGL